MEERNSRINQILFNKRGKGRKRNLSYRPVEECKRNSQGQRSPSYKPIEVCRWTSQGQRVWYTGKLGFNSFLWPPSLPSSLYLRVHHGDVSHTLAVFPGLRKRRRYMGMNGWGEGHCDKEAGWSNGSWSLFRTEVLDARKQCMFFSANSSISKTTILYVCFGEHI